MDKLKLLWSKTNRWHRAFLLFLAVELKLIPGGQFGFQCNDPALSYPFTGDTISWKWLLGTVVLIPLTVMLIVERNYHADEKSPQIAKKRALCWYREYLYGVLINLTTVQTIKLLVGSPRPHFFDTCRPEEALNCQESEYVSSYTCTKPHWFNQSDRSFPSGHTSLSLHAAMFVAYYLHRRTRCSPGSRSVAAVQLLCIISAVLCSVSRLTDHRHHWWDVLAGVVIAAGALYYTVISLCENFVCETPKSDVTDNERTIVCESKTQTIVPKT